MTAIPAARAPFLPQLGLMVAALAIVVDQVSKYIMVEKVMRPEGVVETPFFTAKLIEVLPFFQLRLSWNAGMSFSLFNSGETATVITLLAVRLAVCLALIWWLHRLTRPWLQIACGLIIGGALGNILDTVMFGAVADFLDFYWGSWHFPTFNVADSCISVGAGMVLLDALVSRPHHMDHTKDPAP